MHERSASRPIGEKIANFNNFRWAAQVVQCTNPVLPGRRCCAPLRDNRIDEADLVVAVERSLSGYPRI
jgi:hypothetical protein